MNSQHVIQRGNNRLFPRFLLWWVSRQGLTEKVINRHAPARHGRFSIS
jgi:hypothetical protein